MEDTGEAKSEEADKDLLGSSNSSLELKKIKPPNKKKHEDEIESLQHEIKDKEAQLRHFTGENNPHQLKETRAEKLAVIEKLKKIDTDLKALSQQITKKKGNQDQLQSRLHYRSEDRIDEAIRRLEWQLKVQNFKLTEEKKIVAEIDSLKRSKKDLSQFLAAKKEVDGCRESQRRMREERDRYQKNVNKLRNKEDEIKRSNDERKNKVFVLKKEIEQLKTKRRQMVQDFRQHEKEYNEVKDELKKQKKRDSFKRKEEQVSQMEAFQNDIVEFGLQREPYADEIKLCNTLINYLQKFQVTEDEVEEPSKNPEVADNLDDGKYILLKKTEDNEYSGVRPTKRRPSKKGKKLSGTKPITHAPQIFSQFASLTLNAPSTVAEVFVSIDQVQARKKFYEEGGQVTPRCVITPSIEEQSASETGISATESAMCEMSRQASNTESTENPEVSFSVLDELVKLSNNEDNMSDKSEDTLARSNSDSTEHAQSEGDNSDQSTLSQLEQRSRKGSDVSDTDSTIMFPMSASKKLPALPAELGQVYKSDIPLTDSMNTEKRAWEQIFQIYCFKAVNFIIDTLVDGWINDALTEMTCYQDTKKDTQTEVIHDQGTYKDTQTDVIHDQGTYRYSEKQTKICDEFSDRDTQTECDQNLNNSRETRHICRPDDNFVMIDNNSNIHDLKESSKGQMNGQNQDNVLFSTHF